MCHCHCHCSDLTRLGLTDRTEYLMMNLIERWYSLFTTAKRGFVRVVKSKLCDIALDFVPEQKSTADSSGNERPASLQMAISSQPSSIDKEATGTHNTSFPCGVRGTSNLDDSTPTVVSAEAVEVPHVHFYSGSCRGVFQQLKLCSGNFEVPTDSVHR